MFRFIETLHHCTFPEALRFLAERAGLKLNTFQPSPELTAKVAALKTRREEAMQLQHFVDERIAAVNLQYRALGRAATNAEDRLRAGESDQYIQDLAWAALERYRVFEARIEREGLCDVDILRTEWSKLREVA